MREENLVFICNMFAAFSNWQVQLFKNKELIKKASNLAIPFDVIGKLKERLFETQTTYSTIDDGFCYYGVVKTSVGGGEGKSSKDSYTFIIGPIIPTKPDRTECLNYLHRLGESRDYLDDIYNYFSFATESTATNFNRIFIALHYLFTGETKIPESELFDSLETQKPSEKFEIKKEYKERTNNSNKPHCTYDFETMLFSYIEEGDEDGLIEFTSSFSYPGNAGKLADSTVRDAKNTAIVSTTLAARAAIRGGLNQETAYSMSDSFIQAIERTNDLKSLNLIASQILAAYCKKVADEKYGLKGNKLANEVKKFVLSNIDMRITTAEVAEALDINRTQLCNKFKRITGKTLGNFILELKISDAKRLLKTTNKSLSEISYYLAFSSQSHFQNTFKRLTGVTPQQYREKNYA